MDVPLFELNTQNKRLEGELTEAFSQVLKLGHFILGEAVSKFEAEVASYLDVEHAVGVSSGTDALLLALMAMNVGPGDEVICPSFTFFATAGSIARLGATPVFVDIESASFNLDPESVKEKIRERTKAIIPVHLFGQAAQMDELIAIAEEHDLKIIEDCAQAYGAKYKETNVGGIGDCGCFSFFPTKNLGGFGDAGAVTTNDDAFAEKLKWFRNHGMNPKYYHKYVGGNFRIDALQAALLSVKLKYADEYISARKKNATFYHDALSSVDGFEIAQAEVKVRAPAILLPSSYTFNDHTWNQFTIRVVGEGRRDALKSFLNARQIGSEIYYPLGLHQQECFQKAGFAPASLPVTEAISGQCLSIPIYPELTESMLGEVSNELLEFINDPSL